MGKLIVIDGLDGSGKTTQAELLFKRLKKESINVKRISFPNYDDDSSALVKMYLSGKLGKDPNKINPYAASSFYAVDRFISYEKYWKEFYKLGSIIICDRYVTSNFIYQMIKLPKHEWNNFIQWIEDFEYKKLSLPKPDKVIYLDLEPKISQKLIDERCQQNNVKKDIHEKDIDYLNNCRKAAQYISNCKNWNIIKCSENIDNHSKYTNIPDIPHGATYTSKDIPKPTLNLVGDNKEIYGIKTLNDRIFELVKDLVLTI